MTAHGLLLFRLTQALHDTSARNKSFDVCYEYETEGSSLYELVAHMPDKANNYLTPALATLEVGRDRGGGRWQRQGR